MRLLLDTHVALWAIAGDRRLSAKARSLIEYEDNEVLVSAATVWEISIKHALARGRPNDMPLSGADAMGSFEEAGYVLLPVMPEHAAAVDRVPALHGDPFDRLLLAQALYEPLRLLTRDAKLAAHGGVVELV